MKGENWFARGATLAAALALGLAGLYRGNNPDTFGHLAQGRQIAELGRVPQVDSWSLLPGPRAWHNYEWLSDLGTYLLYARFGYDAVTLFKCGLLMLSAWCLARFAAELAGPRAAVLASLVIVSTIPAIRVRLSDRPHVLGICFAAAYILLFTLLLTRRDRRVRIALVASVALLHLTWVNAHGSHLLGLAISGAFLVLGGREALPALLTTFGLQLLASCISPYGPAIVLDAIDHVVDPRYRALITEWLPWRETDAAWLQLGPALHGAVLTLLAPRLIRHHRAARATLAVSFLLGVASFRSIRFIAEFSLLSAPLLGVGLALSARSLPQRTFALATGGLGVALGLAVVAGARALPPDQGIGLGISYAQLPIASGSVLARYGQTPRVLAAMQDSWFTMFAAPNARLAIDGRVPFYGPDYVRHVGLAFTSKPHFDSVVRESAINTVIFSHAAVEERELGNFTRSAGFALVLLEDLHALYVRDGALTAEGLRSFPPLRALEPTYELGWLLAADAPRVKAMHEELARLSPLPGTSAYRGWVEGVLTLAPLRRGRPGDGFRWPVNANEWATYEKALPLLQRAGDALGFIPIVSAVYAEVATVLCQFERAERALAKATSEEASREPLLVAQELALRRGQVEQVRRVIEQARALPEGKDDPWLAELARGVDDPPSCPH